MQGLYAELWKIKIIQIKEIHGLDSEQVKETLFLIAAEMYNRQQISVNEAIFENYANELKYLKSEQIVLSQGKDIQFFHQSFYDYLFARQFVETRSSIAGYLKRENQTILVRAALKMILNYLREVDAPSYIKQVKSLLGNKKIRFHIHHLILSTIAAAETPSVDEKRLLRSIVEKNKIFLITFCEHCSIGWINYVIESGIIDKMLFPGKETYLVRQFRKFRKNILRSKGKTSIATPDNVLQNIAVVLLQRCISGAPEIVLPHLEKFSDKDIVLNILYYLNSWNSPEALALLESCRPISIGDWRYSKILEDLVSVNPAYVFEKVKDFITDDHFSSSNDQHIKENLLKKLFEFFPEPTSNFILGYFIERIDDQKRDYRNKPLIQDYIIYDISFDAEYFHGNSFLFHQLLNHLKSSASKNNGLFPILPRCESYFLALPGGPKGDYLCLFR